MGIFRAFKRAITRELVNIENIQPEFLEAGGAETWYANNVVSFLLDCFRVSNPKGYAVTKHYWDRVGGKYNKPVAKVKRQQALLEYLGDPEKGAETLLADLKDGNVFGESWEK